jgi:glycosyl transferase family 2
MNWNDLMAADLGQTVDAALEHERRSDRKPGLPLVSLLIVNYNYAAYLDRTIHSIRRQTYSCFECMIVDNASTDDSIAVIDRATAGDSRFTVVRLDENLGQLRAAMHVFDRIRGSFVVVVDADDLLFPEFLAWHLQVHLALPAAVGFTSSDVMEIDADDRVLTGGRSGFAANCESEPRGLKEPLAAVRLASISDADYQQLSEATVAVSYRKFQWVWAPGTANMYRKAALELALPEVSQFRSRVGFEGYFCAILHLMAGSALICRPLSAYRIHGQNDFGSSPSMNAVRLQQRYEDMRPGIQQLAVLRTILSRAQAFDSPLAGDGFWSRIDLLSGIEGLGPQAYFAQNTVQQVLAENFRSLLATRGARTLLSEMCDRLPPDAVRRVMSRAYERSVPLSLRWALAKESARRWRLSFTHLRGRNADSGNRRASQREHRPAGHVP